MSILLVIGSALMLFGGFIQLWASVQWYRRGEPWRGMGLMAVAVTLYGGLTLVGALFFGRGASTVLVWFTAVAIWTGLWLYHRERTRSDARDTGSRPG